MKKTTKHIIFYCVDNDVLNLNYFRENFKPNLSYSLFTFNSVKMFINQLREDTKKKSFKIVIIDNIVKSVRMNTKTAIEILPLIKSIDPDIQVIIFADSKNMALKATSSKVRPAAFIKKDSQYFVRLYPLIDRLISQCDLKNKVNSRRYAIIIFILTISISAILCLLGYLFY